MAGIDYTIPGQIKGVQIEPPMNAMARAMELRNMQDAAQMNALKRQEYQRGVQQRNALAAIHADPNLKVGSPEYLTRVQQDVPDLYTDVVANVQKRAKLEEEIDERKFKNFERKFSLFKSIVPNIDSEGGVYQYVQAAYNDPDLKPILEQIQPLEVALESNANAFNRDAPGWRAQASGISAEKLAEIAREKSKPIVVGNRLVSPEGEELFAAPKEVTPTELVRNYEYAKTPEGGGFKGTLEQFKALSAPRTNITLAPQEKAFETELGKGQAEGIMKSKTAATDAADNIKTIRTAREIMKSGMITGAGADFLVNFNQALKTAGIDAGYADASANSQAFTANMANSVGKLIKQFGAGTGLSDADRKYAIEMAGGRVSLDAKAINRILDINERAARNVIARHNKDVKGIKTNIPLEVEAPEASTTTPTATPPAKAIDYLRANPSMKGAFDAKYGAGAADRALKGK
jgi:hypothetical protein